jgi:hypothetical protein
MTSYSHVSPTLSVRGGVPTLCAQAIGERTSKVTADFENKVFMANPLIGYTPAVPVGQPYG